MFLKRRYWLIGALLGSIGSLIALLFVRSPQTVIDPYSCRPGQPLPGLTASELEIFRKGEALFKHEFTPEEGLGPLFAGRSCFECHGRPGAAGLEGTDPDKTNLVRFGKILDTSALAKDPVKARELDDIYSFSAMVDQGGPVLRRRSITEEFPGKYPAGCTLIPRGLPAKAQFESLRHAGPLLGAGLIDAIDEQTILSNMIKQAKVAPYLVGRSSPTTNPLTGSTKVGRFGWKANQPDLLLATAEALNSAMGITTEAQAVTRDASGLSKVPDCLEQYLPANPNDDGRKMVLLSAYQSLLAPPPAAVRSAAGKRGEKLFEQLKCAACHTPELETAPIVEIPDPASKFPALRYVEIKALEQQPVKLYSDLLLHKMGHRLADGIVQATARGGEWRTAPLWGLRYRKVFLHSGEALSIHEAILAHGGQAEPVTRAYKNLPQAEKNDLLEFLKSL